MYEIIYNVTFRNNSSVRSSVLSELRLNNIRIDANDLYTYHRNYTGGYQTSSRTLILTLAQTNLLSIHSRRFEGNENSSLITVTDAISISIKKLD